MFILSFDIGIKNLAYCFFEYTNKQFFILDWQVLNCQASNQQDVIKNVIKNLDELNYLYENANVIIIEKQPKCNPKMRIINNCVYMYYTIKTIDNNKIKIINYSPKYKLNCCDIKVETKVKSKYQQNKKIGIEHTRFLIKETNWLTFFNGFSKKDDLADSFLQGLSYCLK